MCVAGWHQAIANDPGGRGCGLLFNRNIQHCFAKNFVGFAGGAVYAWTGARRGLKQIGGVALTANALDWTR